jgi:hypothetical protein
MISINGHQVRLDAEEGLLPWATYDQVVWLAMEFIRRCPVDPRTGLPWYLAYSCFWTDPLRPTDWPDNPAGKFAMAVETLVRFYPYSGEDWFTDVVRTMLKRLIAYHTPSSAAWPQVPFASAEPVFGNYFGARADGHQVTEPDKVAQAALGYVLFFQQSGEEEFLDPACRCADVLAEKALPGDQDHSPWPFRVDVRSGAVVEVYTSHVLPAIRLFDALIKLGLDKNGRYQETGEKAWCWLMEFPIQNQCWKGYFEDIRLDPENENRDQYSALETAKYLLQNQDRDPDWMLHAREIIEWVEGTFGADPFYQAIPIHEQLFCFHVMGSHTARYASLCALYASCTGEVAFRERAIRAFNWSTYMADEQGSVRVGIDEPDYYNQCWFTDGYFDYVPHFLDGMALLPETAPHSQDHLLQSSSIIKGISYQPRRISYQTFDPSGEEFFRLTFQPTAVFSKGEILQEGNDSELSSGWYFDPERCTLKISHPAPEVEIRGN